jgi:hypothetical protein
LNIVAVHSSLILPLRNDSGRTAAWNEKMLALIFNTGIKKLVVRLLLYGFHLFC